MADMLRDSAMGQLLRLVKREWFPYPDERLDYKLPDYEAAIDQEQEKEKSLEQSTPADNHESRSQAEERTESVLGQQPDLEILRLATTVTEGHGDNAAEHAASHALTPMKTSDGIVLVDWYTTGMY